MTGASVINGTSFQRAAGGTGVRDVCKADCVWKCVGEGVRAQAPIYQVPAVSQAGR